MKIFLLALLSFSAFSNVVYKCNFTEPFMNITLDDVNNTLTYSDPEDMNGTTYDVEVSVASGPVIVATGEKSLSIELNSWDANDGMSDCTYPFTGVFGSYYGGCEAVGVVEKVCEY